jgi:Uma2 family endonuclease
VILEVLSPDSEAHDRGEKFWLYRQVPSVEEVVLVSQTVPLIETYTRRVDGKWTLRVFEWIDAVARLQTLAIDIPLAEVFAGVEFPSVNEAIEPASS